MGNFPLKNIKVKLIHNFVWKSNRIDVFDEPQHPSQTETLIKPLSSEIEIHSVTRGYEKPNAFGFSGTNYISKLF